jgi:hypothetical protein
MVLQSYDNNDQHRRDCSYHKVREHYKNPCRRAKKLKTSPVGLQLVEPRSVSPRCVWACVCVCALRNPHRAPCSSHAKHKEESRQLSLAVASFSRRTGGLGFVLRKRWACPPLMNGVEEPPFDIRCTCTSTSSCNTRSLHLDGLVSSLS